MKPPHSFHREFSDRYGWVCFSSWETSRPEYSNIPRPSQRLRRHALQKIALLSANYPTVEAKQSDFAKLFRACSPPHSGPNAFSNGPSNTCSRVTRAPIVGSKILRENKFSTNCSPNIVVPLRARDFACALQSWAPNR